MRISKYKRVYAPNCSEEAFAIKNTGTWTCEIENLMNCKGPIKQNLGYKNDELYLKWKYYNNLFNIRINEKILLYEMSYFQEPCTHSVYKVKVELIKRQNLI